MGFIVKAGVDFTPIEPGMYAAVCIGVIDLGTQHSEKYGPSSKVLLQFEIPEEKVIIEGVEQPRTLSKIYTASLGKKANLRRDLDSWRGRAFTKEELNGWDLTNVLGAPCMLNIVHQERGDRVYANIANISPLPKNYPPPVSGTPHTTFLLMENQPIPEHLPDWVKNMIGECEELQSQKSHVSNQPPPQSGSFPSEAENMDKVPF